MGSYNQSVVANQEQYQEPVLFCGEGFWDPRPLLTNHLKEGIPHLALEIFIWQPNYLETVLASMLGCSRLACTTHHAHICVYSEAYTIVHSLLNDLSCFFYSSSVFPSQSPLRSKLPQIPLFPFTQSWWVVGRATERQPLATPQQQSPAHSAWAKT